MFNRNNKSGRYLSDVLDFDGVVGSNLYEYNAVQEPFRVLNIIFHISQVSEISSSQTGSKKQFKKFE